MVLVKQTVKLLYSLISKRLRSSVTYWIMLGPRSASVQKQMLKSRNQDGHMLLKSNGQV